MLKVNEIFRSIQGEGMSIGAPTVFVRLTGCNIRCKWCDTKYAYEEGRRCDIIDVIGEIEKLTKQNDYICITGGEPLAQEDTSKLIKMLTQRMWPVVLETNGSINLVEVLPAKGEKLQISMDMKAPSSGMDGMMKFDEIKKLRSYDQLKFVISDETDWLWMLGVIAKYQPKCNVIIQPCGGVEVKWLVERALKELDCNVRILPQIHKIIWPPEMRGV